MVQAFADQNLTKRLGLPVIPLACLFIRASLQTYQMFLATQVPLPSFASPITTAAVTTSLTETLASSTNTSNIFSSMVSDAFQHIDFILGRLLSPPFPVPSIFARIFSLMSISVSIPYPPLPTISQIMLFVFLLISFLVFLSLKLVLGICLLGFARRRYKTMKSRERMNYLTGARRVGGFGTIEVNEDQKKWLYADDPEGARQARERDLRGKATEERGGIGLENVRRYSMAAKRIW
jgi:Eukaryotic membrane protein family